MKYLSFIQFYENQEETKTKDIFLSLSKELNISLLSNSKEDYEILKTLTDEGKDILELWDLTQKSSKDIQESNLIKYLLFSLKRRSKICICKLLCFYLDNWQKEINISEESLAIFISINDSNPIINIEDLLDQLENLWYRIKC